VNRDPSTRSIYRNSKFKRTRLLFSQHHNSTLMMQIKPLCFWLVRLLCLLICGSAWAHSVWIEPASADRLLVRFAEPDGRLEASPGHLDSLTTPVAFSVMTNTPVPVEATKGTNYFLLVAASSTHPACAETSFTVMSASGKPGRKPIFYARWQPSLAEAGVPSLNLDVVPTGRSGEVRVYFRGQPLGGVKATLRTPDEVESEVTADANGFIRFDSKQAGQHHLSIARHRESLAGFHVGKPHDLTSHNFALTWRQP
jgi:hypothetical protein